MDEMPFDSWQSQGTTLGLLSLPNALSSAPIARDRVRAIAAGWHPPLDSDAAELVTAEMVTNAVKYSDRTISVKFSVFEDGTSLLIEVFDWNPLIPEQPAEAAEFAEGGRGLAIVHEFTSGHGAYPAAGGKVMWAVLGPQAFD